VCDVAGIRESALFTRIFRIQPSRCHSCPRLCAVSSLTCANASPKRCSSRSTAGVSQMCSACADVRSGWFLRTAGVLKPRARAGGATTGVSFELVLQAISSKRPELVCSLNANLADRHQSNFNRPDVHSTMFWCLSQGLSLSMSQGLACAYLIYVQLCACGSHARCMLSMVSRGDACFTARFRSGCAEDCHRSVEAFHATVSACVQVCSAGTHHDAVMKGCRCPRKHVCSAMLLHP
jgi:hypothetical protein